MSSAAKPARTRRIGPLQRGVGRHLPLAYEGLRVVDTNSEIHAHIVVTSDRSALAGRERSIRVLSVVVDWKPVGVKVLNLHSDFGCARAPIGHVDLPSKVPVAFALTQ